MVKNLLEASGHPCQRLEMKKQKLGKITAHQGQFLGKHHSTLNRLDQSLLLSLVNRAPRVEVELMPLLNVLGSMP